MAKDNLTLKIMSFSTNDVNLTLDQVMLCEQLRACSAIYENLYDFFTASLCFLTLSRIRRPVWPTYDCPHAHDI